MQAQMAVELACLLSATGRGCVRSRVSQVVRPVHCQLAEGECTEPGACWPCCCVQVAEARKLLSDGEIERSLNSDRVVAEALRAAQQDGIVFIDEVDKIVETSRGVGGATSELRTGASTRLGWETHCLFGMCCDGCVRSLCICHVSCMARVPLHQQVVHTAFHPGVLLTATACVCVRVARRQQRQQRGRTAGASPLGKSAFATCLLPTHLPGWSFCQ